MIQLIVYTGFYWAVKVMESLLVVNSTTACSLACPESALCRASESGRNGRAGHRLLMLTIYGCDEFPAP